MEQEDTTGEGETGENPSSAELKGAGVSSQRGGAGSSHREWSPASKMTAWSQKQREPSLSTAEQLHSETQTPRLSRACLSLFSVVLGSGMGEGGSREQPPPCL